MVKYKNYSNSLKSDPSQFSSATSISDFSTCYFSRVSIENSRTQFLKFLKLFAKFLKYLNKLAYSTTNMKTKHSLCELFLNGFGLDVLGSAPELIPLHLIPGSFSGRTKYEINLFALVKDWVFCYNLTETLSATIIH